MPVPFYSPIDLNNLELLQALLENLGADPTGTAGRVIYRTDEGNPKWYDGVAAQWRTFASTDNAGNADTLDGLDSTQFIRSDQSDNYESGTLTFDAGTTLDMSAAITTVATPINPTDAANKLYVDNAIQGLDHKASVRVATLVNITASGTPTIDGVTVADGDRVLVKNQTDLTENGIYVVNAAGTWSRAPDMDESDEFASASVFVEEGSLEDTLWVCIVDEPFVLETDDVVWTQFSGAGGGVTDHGALTGLADDDHTQYFNSTRHDAHDHSAAMTAVVLEDISDVVETTITTGDLLRWNGTNWVNYADSNYATSGHTHTSAGVTDFAEAVSDQVGTMVTGNTETGITVTYDDADNTLDFALSYGAGAVGLTPDNVGTGGVVSTVSRSDHVHSITAAAPTTNLSATTTNTEGAASSFARSNHTHGITTAVTPTTIQPDAAAAVGTSAGLARGDHTHAIDAAAAVGLSDASTNTEGTSTSFSRADHTHAVTGFALTAHTHTESDITDLDHLTIEEVQDNLGTSFLVAGTDISLSYDDGLNTLTINSTATGVTDHGALTGLADDDHTQYLNTTRHDAHDHSTAMGTVVLDDISDVVETTITTGDVLRWNGTNWVNYPDSNFAGSGHNHDADYVNVTGDTMTGDLTIDQSSLTFGVLNEAFQPVYMSLQPSYDVPSSERRLTFVDVGKVTVPGWVQSTYTFLTRATGQPPMYVNSTTLVDNLNADMLDGLHASDLAVQFETNSGPASDPGPFPDNPVRGAVPASYNGRWGTSDVAARADHSHFVNLSISYSANTPISLTPDIAGATGTGWQPARWDHVHNVPAAAPTTSLTASTTNAEGTGSSFARNDHTHAITTAVTPTTIQPDDAAAVGTSAGLARGDHKHAIVAAAAVGLSDVTTNTEGAATSFARSDHTHAVTGFATTGHGHTLDGLSDVVITTPGDGQVLTYDSGTGNWVNEDATGGSGGHPHVNTVEISDGSTVQWEIDLELDGTLSFNYVGV